VLYYYIDLNRSKGSLHIDFYWILDNLEEVRMNEDFTTCFVTDEQKKVWGPILRAHGIFPHSPEDGLAFFYEKWDEREFFAECRNAERIEEQLLGPDIMALDEKFSDQLREEAVIDHMLRRRSKRGDRLTRTEQVKANKAAKKKLTNTYCKSKPWGMPSCSARHYRGYWGHTPGKEERLRNQSVINEQLLEMLPDLDQAAVDQQVRLANDSLKQIRQMTSVWVGETRHNIAMMETLLPPFETRNDRKQYGPLHGKTMQRIAQAQNSMEELGENLRHVCQTMRLLVSGLTRNRAAVAGSPQARQASGCAD
jgi:hypothetical protein